MTLTIVETINGLTEEILSSKKTLDDGLFALQNWLEQNAALITDYDRDTFSRELNAEKETMQRDGQAFGTDTTLIASVLRLHAMRLFYRFDERRTLRESEQQDDSPYGRAKQRFQAALREVEIAVNEARIDTAIANAHQILADKHANRRWLQDALIRLQTAAQKDLVKLAESVPMPELPPLTLPQRIMFRIFNIKQEELGRRSLQSMKKIAELQTTQLVEMVRLLVDSFNAIGDAPGTQQALSLLVRLGAE